jgi:glycerophosphoryl diester phosphodiesterase
MALNAAFLIVGHRGAAGLEPENTLRSFARAIDLGVDAVELDVYCVDDRLVVIHDDTLERTTNGHGPVAETPFEALRWLDAGAGELIPTLEEVIELVAGRVAINVELKGDGTAAPVARCIERQPNAEILVSSFEHAELGRFRRESPNALVAPLFHKPSPQMFVIAGALGAWSINVSGRLATPALLSEIAERGYRSLVYTINDNSIARALRDGGAGGIFTDYPDRMLDLRASRRVVE